MQTSFNGINGYDIVRFTLRDGTVASAKANPLLLFASHVVVNRGTCGTVVDETNYISHKASKASKPARYVI